MNKLVSLVTGTASGLGKATAQYLLRSGTKVLAFDQNYNQENDINTDTFLEECHKQNIDFPKENCVCIKGDILSVKDVELAVGTVMNQWGRINAVVNCAGSATHRLVYNQPKDKLHDYQLFKDLIEVNVCGTFNVIRLAAQQMAKNIPTPGGSRGVIINTSGVDAYSGLFGASINSASAGAIASMTLPIARDLSSLGIRVMGIAPGYFTSNLIHTHVADVNNIISNCSIFPNRVGDPIEFEHCVEFIIKNEMLNGEVIRLDAGCTLPTTKLTFNDVKTRS